MTSILICLSLIQNDLLGFQAFSYSFLIILNSLYIIKMYLLLTKIIIFIKEFNLVN